MRRAARRRTAHVASMLNQLAGALPQSSCEGCGVSASFNRPEPLRLTVPSVAPLSLKVTVSPAVEKPLQVTVALKVTDWPAVDGLTLDIRAVLVVTVVTTWARTGEVDAPQLASPP